MVSKLTNNVKPLDEVDKINEIIDELDNIDPLPSQTGQSGKYLTTNGTVPSWADVNSLPSQTGKAGLYLQTDGADASWEGVPGRNIGEVVASTIPLTDAGLHLLDGSLIQGSGIYSAFVDYIAGLYEADPTANYFAQPQDEEQWTQPILTTNGIVGGDSFACFSSSEYDNRYLTYQAFDGNISNLTSSYTYWCSSSKTGTQFIGFYNPEPLKVTALRLYNNRASSGDGVIASGTVQGSNDNSTYTDIGTFSGNTYGTTYIDVDLSSNTSFYKYYRIVANTYTGNYATMGEIVITAVTANKTAEQVWQQSVNTYGVCGKFVYDSTNNTVRLPKVTGIIEGTTDVSALGDLVEAGLPNITGTVPDPFGSGAGTWTGAFSKGAYNGSITTSAVDYDGYNISFDASRSSSRYGNSSTVQPQTIKAFYYIVIATSTKTDIQVDIDEIATDLNGKVDKSSLQEVQCVVETYVNGTSWYRVYSDGWCEQGGYISSTASGTAYSLLKPMKDANYTINITAVISTWSGGLNSVYDLTTSSFKVWTSDDSTFNACPLKWEVKGYMAV